MWELFINSYDFQCMTSNDKYINFQSSNMIFHQIINEHFNNIQTYLVGMFFFTKILLNSKIN